MEKISPEVRTKYLMLTVPCKRTLLYTKQWKMLHVFFWVIPQRLNESQVQCCTEVKYINLHISWMMHGKNTNSQNNRCWRYEKPHANFYSLLYIALKNTECKGPMFLKGTNSNHDVQLILKYYSGK